MGMRNWKQAHPSEHTERVKVRKDLYKSFYSEVKYFRVHMGCLGKNVKGEKMETKL